MFYCGQYNSMLLDFIIRSALPLHGKKIVVGVVKIDYLYIVSYKESHLRKLMYQLSVLFIILWRSTYSQIWPIVDANNFDRVFSILYFTRRRMQRYCENKTY